MSAFAQQIHIAYCQMREIEKQSEPLDRLYSILELAMKSQIGTSGYKEALEIVQKLQVDHSDETFKNLAAEIGMYLKKYAGSP